MSTQSKSNAGLGAVALLLGATAIIACGALGGAAGFIAMLWASTIALACWRFRFRNDPSMFAPMNIVLALFGAGTFLSTFHVAAIQQMETLGNLSIAPSEVVRQVYTALGLTTIALLVFVTISKLLLKSSQTEVPSLQNRYPIAPANIALVGILTVVGLYGVRLYLGTRGGLDVAVSAWNDRDGVESSLWDLMIYALPAASLLLLASVRNPLTILPLGHLAVGFACLSVTGSRHEGVRLVFAALILLWFSSEARSQLLRWRGPLAVAAFGGFLAYVIVVGGYRGLAGAQSRLSSAGTLIENIQAAGFFQKLLSAYYLPSIQTVATVTAIYPARATYLEGDSFLTAADVWVPRVIYADFPSVKLGHELFEIVNGEAWDSALYANYVGELYANWGWPGIPLGMFFLAVGTTAIYRFVRRRSHLAIYRFGYAIAMGLTLPYLLTVESLHTASTSVGYVGIWIVAAFVNLAIGHSGPKVVLKSASISMLRRTEPVR